MSRHLGDLVHDLLDGRLRGDKANAAMAHLGECDECAARFQELRMAREALNSSQCGIDLRFTQLLYDKERMAQVAAAEPRHAARAARPPRKMPYVLAGSGLGVTVAMVGVAYQVGAPSEVTLELADSKAASAVNVAYVDAHSMRAGEQLGTWIHPDFSASELIPVDANVVRLSDGQLALVATLLSDMDEVTVVQQHGYLSQDFASHFQSADVEGAEVFVVPSTDSSTVVWQTGDVVVALTCQCALSTLESVAEEFPSASDPGFVERVSTGLESLVGAQDH